MSNTGTQVWGVVPVLDTSTKTESVVLCSAQGRSNGTMLSAVEFVMNDSISTPDSNYAIQLSLHSFSFYNSFKNITASNNKLEIITAYKVYGVLHYDTMKVTVPPGHYSFIQLLNYLNSPGVCSRYEGGYYYGLGRAANAPAEAVPAFTGLEECVIQSITAPPAAPLPAAVAAHTYHGFYLIHNDDTQPLLDILGFPTTDELLTFDMNGVKVTTGFTYSDGYAAPPDVANGVKATTITAQDVANLPGINSLAISLESIHSSVRIGAGLNISDTFTVVPVAAAYGGRVHYEPITPIVTSLTNFNLNVFKIEIRNVETGFLVDFEGVDWVMILTFRSIEVEVARRSANGRAGVGDKLLPLFHHHSTEFVTGETTIDMHKRDKGAARKRQRGFL